MTIKYHSGKRIQGTSADATASSGGWKFISRTVVGAGSVNNTPISVSSIPDNRYYMVMCSGKTNQTNADHSWKFNNSGTDTHYGIRQSWSGGGDNEYTSQQFIRPIGTTDDAQFFDVMHIANKSDKEKLLIGQAGQTTASDTSSADSITRSEYSAKYKPSSHSAINQIQALCTNSGSSQGYKQGTEVVVLAWDTTLVDSNNYWTELKNVSGDGTTSFNTGTFALKKYLWIQVYVDRSGSSNNTEFTCGTGGSLDGQQNYAQAINEDGGADETSNRQDQNKMTIPVYGEEQFINLFVNNSSSAPKIFLAKGNISSSTQSHILRAIYKWANNSQMNIFGVSSGGSNTLSTSSKIKVWGAD